MVKVRGFGAGLFLALALLSGEEARSKTRYYTVGTGGLTGLYYPTGGNIAKMVNKKRKQLGVRLSVESTAGSVYNINAVTNGDLNFGIAQSDRQYQAWKGLAEWKKKGPRKNLRAICSFHKEAVTLVAADQSGITDLKSLKGKRVNLGNHGSGQRGNAMDVLSTAGLNPGKDLEGESLKASEAPRMLQDGRIDAFFYTVGHPSGAITEATSGRTKVRFVPITGMKSLLQKYPYYSSAVVPAGNYPMAETKKDIPTIGVTATFITAADTPDDVVYGITKEIFENLDAFRKLHPAYARLTPKAMLDGLSAPLHPGAEKYFREVGLLK